MKPIQAPPLPKPLPEALTLPPFAFFDGGVAHSTGEGTGPAFVLAGRISDTTTWAGWGSTTDIVGRTLGGADRVEETPLW